MNYYPFKDAVQAVTKYHTEGITAKGHDECDYKTYTAFI